MAEEPDLDMAMTRLLAEIAGVLNKAAGRPADPAWTCASYNSLRN
jgi:hypothetical protein